MMNDFRVYLVLLVHSYDQAIDFYCDKSRLFSVRVDCRSMRNVQLTYAQSSTAFNLLLHLPEDQVEFDLAGRQAGDSRPLMILPVDDFWGVHSRLVEVGIAFVREISELPYGYQGTIVDPFGNRIVLSEQWSK